MYISFPRVKGGLQDTRHLMGRMDSRESDSENDLEYGEIRRRDERICNGRHSKKIADDEWNVVRGPNGSVKGGDRFSTDENVEIYVDELGEQDVSLMKNKMAEDKKKSSSKKPPKPPRPPGTPLFDEADLKLCRGISQLARLKYARIRRMKALRRNRTDEASSPLVSFFAMAITVILCFYVIFQGILGSKI